MNDNFDNMLDVALKHVSKHAEEAAMYKALFEEVAYYLLRSLEGDDINDEAYSLMKKHKLVDEDGFWIYEDN